jgi:peptide chain release factor 3
MELNVLMKISLHKACWVKPDDAKNMSLKNLNNQTKVLSKTNMDNGFLADSDFTIQMTQNKYPSVNYFYIRI